MAHHNIVEKDIDVGHLMRVERSDHSVGVGDLVSAGGNELQDQTNLHNLCHVEIGGNARISSQ